MKTIYLSLFILLTAVCFVHTKSCRKKCQGKADPDRCIKKCQCKKECERKADPDKCMKKCQCEEKCEGKPKPNKCLKECMQVFASGKNKFIIGGANANPGEWPWQVSLHDKDGDEHFCGAAVISNQWVVTAAHCLEKVTQSSCWGYSIQLLLGLHDQRILANIPRYEVAQIINHPNYVANETLAYPNDIALIRVVGTIDLAPSNIATVMMAPNDNYDYTTSECWLTGWGATQVGNPPTNPANILQEAESDVIPQGACVSEQGAGINDGHMCFREITDSKGSCSGDSGGPAVCKRDNQWYLVGVTSFGGGDCNPASSSVYSRISFFRNWINQETGV